MGNQTVLSSLIKDLIKEYVSTHLVNYDDPESINQMIKYPEYN
jgi:hypothetical protein